MRHEEAHAAGLRLNEMEQFGVAQIEGIASETDS